MAGYSRYRRILVVAHGCDANWSGTASPANCNAFIVQYKNVDRARYELLQKDANDPVTVKFALVSK